MDMLIYLIIAGVVLIIILFICFRILRSRYKVKKAEEFRQKAEESARVRSMSKRQPTNSLTAGVHTKNVKESDWNLVEKSVDKNEKSKSRGNNNNTHTPIPANSSKSNKPITINSIEPEQYFTPLRSTNLHKSTHTQSFEHSKSHSNSANITPIGNHSPNIGSANTNNYNYGNNNPNPSFGQITENIASGVNGNVDFRRVGSVSGNNSKTNTPLAISPRNPNSNHGTQDSTHLAPISLGRKASGTLSSDMLFGSQEQFDNAKKASFHKQSHVGRPKLGKIDSNSKGMESSISNGGNIMNEPQLKVPTMLSASIGAGVSGLSVEDDEFNFGAGRGRSVTDMMPDEDDIDIDDDNGMNMDDNDDIGGDKQRMRQISAMSPEIAYEQEKVIKEKELRKQKSAAHLHTLLHVEEATQGIHNHSEDEMDEIDMGKTAYGNDSGIVGNDDSRDNSFEM